MVLLLLWTDFVRFSDAIEICSTHSNVRASFNGFHIHHRNTFSESQNTSHFYKSKLRIFESQRLRLSVFFSPSFRLAFNIRALTWQMHWKHSTTKTWIRNIFSCYSVFILIFHLVMYLKFLANNMDFRCMNMIKYGFACTIFNLARLEEHCVRWGGVGRAEYSADNIQYYVMINYKLTV